VGTQAARTFSPTLTQEVIREPAKTIEEERIPV